LEDCDDFGFGFHIFFFLAVDFAFFLPFFRKMEEKKKGQIAFSAKIFLVLAYM
jgi:hypothetical protein